MTKYTATVRDDRTGMSADVVLRDECGVRGVARGRIDYTRIAMQALTDLALTECVFAAATVDADGRKGMHVVVDVTLQNHPQFPLIPPSLLILSGTVRRFRDWDGWQAVVAEHGLNARLDLLFIRESSDWTSARIARLSEYPTMAMSGDWSGIRDSSDQQIDQMFTEAVAAKADAMAALQFDGAPDYVLAAFKRPTTPKRTRPSYRAAVQWIADNDSPGDDEAPDVISGYISAVLVADLFGVDQRKVGRDVWNARRKVRTR